MVKLGTNVLAVILSPNLHRKEDYWVNHLKGKGLEKVYLKGRMYFIRPGLLIDLAKGRQFMVKHTLKYSKNYVHSSMKTNYKSMPSIRNGRR